MNKIQFLKFLDKIIGQPLISLISKIRKPGKNIQSQIKRILVIRPGGIGDAVLLLPAIKALKDIFPHSYIDILCEKRNAEIFRLCQGINALYLYDYGLGLLKCLRSKYDIVIDTEQWHRLSAVAAYLTGAPVRVGFNTNERGKLFTEKIPYSHDNYEIYSFLNLLEPLSGKTPDFNEDAPFLDCPMSFSDPACPVHSEDRDATIAIFPGASVDERRWGGERYGAVAKMLQDEGYKIIILGSGADCPDAEKIKTSANRSIDLCGKTTLQDVALILSRCKLLITADSGVMHIAYAVGTATVSLFGAGIERKWAPRGKNHIVLNRNLQCSPCTKFGYTPGCNKGVACLQEIAIGEVLHAVQEILNARKESLRETEKSHE